MEKQELSNSLRISPTVSTVLSFRKIDEPLGWLSNMSRHPIRVDTLRYPTCEHFFQCMRFDDEDVKKAIREEKSPMGAKMVAKKYLSRMVVVPRGEKDLELMRTVIRIKMEFYPKLKQELILQDPKSVIVEDCSKRGGESSKFWGMKFNGTAWDGANWLGRLWMEFRGELQDEAMGSKLNITCWPGSTLVRLRDSLSANAVKSSGAICECNCPAILFFEKVM